MSSQNDIALGGRRGGLQHKSKFAQMFGHFFGKLEDKTFFSFVGKDPYEFMEYENASAFYLLDFLEDGGRLRIPEGCPDEVYVF